MRRLLWRPALAVLLGVLALGGKCRLGLQDTATGPARPKRFCRTLEFEYRRPPDAPRGLQTCLYMALIEFRPGQGEVRTELYYPLDPRGCDYSTPGIVQVGPDRWRFTFRDVYMPYPDEFGDVLWVSDSGLRDVEESYRGLIPPPEVTDAQMTIFRGYKALIFHLKEEGTCVGG